MATAKEIRLAHKIMHNWEVRERLDLAELRIVRSLLPEPPKQKTLEEIAWDMHFAWSETFGNDWKEELFGDLETWLSEQHAQLRDHLEGVKSETHPEFLETEGDYYAAPEGTVVTAPGRIPWIKEGGRDWSCSGGTNSDSAMAKSGQRSVLRWGWGS